MLCLRGTGVGATVSHVFVIVALFLGASRADAGAIIPDAFNSNILGPCDDCAEAAALGFTLDFRGTEWTQLFVNNNGNVTFGGAFPNYIPSRLIDVPLGGIIAPFWADVDKAGGQGGEVTYGTGTFDGHAAFGVNWLDVRPYYQGPWRNSFQLILVDRSDVNAGDWDVVFNYDELEWTFGQGSSGWYARAGLAFLNPDFVPGGGSFPSVGVELPGSGTASIVNLVSGSFDSGGVLGRYVISYRNGAILFPVASASPPSGPISELPKVPVPEPTTLCLLGVGGAGLGARARRRKQHPSHITPVLGPGKKS